MATSDGLETLNIQRGCMAPMEKHNSYKRSYRECIRKENMLAEKYCTETELLGRSTARCLTLCISLIQKPTNCFGTTGRLQRKICFIIPLPRRVREISICLLSVFSLTFPTGNVPVYESSHFITSLVVATKNAESSLSFCMVHIFLFYKEAQRKGMWRDVATGLKVPWRGRQLS